MYYMTQKEISLNVLIQKELPVACTYTDGLIASTITDALDHTTSIHLTIEQYEVTSKLCDSSEGIAPHYTLRSFGDVVLKLKTLKELLQQALL